MPRAPRQPDYEPDEDDLAQIGQALNGLGTENNYEGIKVALNRVGGRGTQAQRARKQGYTNPKRLEVTLRRAKALELRRAGFSYSEIAARPELKYKSDSQVADDIRRILAQIIDVPARDTLALELSRLDAMTQTLWKNVREGDLSSMDRLLRVMKHRQELLGLAAPVKVEHVQKSQMDAEVERLLTELDKMSEGNEGIADDVDGVPAAESYAASKAALEMQKADQVKAIRSK